MEIQSKLFSYLMANSLDLLFDSVALILLKPGKGKSKNLEKKLKQSSRKCSLRKWWGSRLESLISTEEFFVVFMLSLRGSNSVWMIFWLRMIWQRLIRGKPRMNSLKRIMRCGRKSTMIRHGQKFKITLLKVGRSEMIQEICNHFLAPFFVFFAASSYSLSLFSSSSFYFSAFFCSIYFLISSS